VIEFIGWCTICIVILYLLGKVFKAKASKDRSWYEDPIFKKEEDD